MLFNKYSISIVCPVRSSFPGSHYIHDTLNMIEIKSINIFFIFFIFFQGAIGTEGQTFDVTVIDSVICLLCCLATLLICLAVWRLVSEIHIKYNS